MISGIFFRTALTFSLGFLLLFAVRTQAQTAPNAVQDWLWSGSSSQSNAYGGSGWWNGNSAVCDVDTNGFVDVLCGGDNATRQIFVYGISTPETDGSVSGYAWNDRYGWLSFEVGDVAGCPSGECSARRKGNVIEGWARILSIRNGGANAGGWSGWVKLSSSDASNTFDPDLPLTADNWGVDVRKMDGQGTSPTYAYSDELGWIDFSRLRVQNIEPQPLPQDECTEEEANICNIPSSVDIISTCNTKEIEGLNGCSQLCTVRGKKSCGNLWREVQP